MPFQVQKMSNLWILGFPQNHPPAPITPALLYPRIHLTVGHKCPSDTHAVATKMTGWQARQWQGHWEVVSLWDELSITFSPTQHEGCRGLLQRVIKPQKSEEEMKGNKTATPTQVGKDHFFPWPSYQSKSCHEELFFLFEQHKQQDYVSQIILNKKMVCKIYRTPTFCMSVPTTLLLASCMSFESCFFSLRRGIMKYAIIVRWLFHSNIGVNKYCLAHGISIYCYSDFIASINLVLMHYDNTRFGLPYDYCLLWRETSPSYMTDSRSPHLLNRYQCMLHLLNPEMFH